ncbi:hypothetical protein ASE30_07085 [Achromobacter sp. Root83]|uniref:hypothetical protein n=1 Tax=Achromobacter sp. Root83 TaxID=1736602 RepID=UPI00070AC856|nr:hypothetical protein [Achromobacter sp. Root83]KRC76666.1 hypothetical protein ASE30_07085 [Achromobacter sp. Root83]
MMTLRFASRLVLLGAACASLAACADAPPRQAAPAATTQGANSASSGQRLTIQSGEGERLNLPWFIQGTQDWINSN